MPPEKVEYGAAAHCDDDVEAADELLRAAAVVHCIAASLHHASKNQDGGALTVVPLGRIPSLEKCPAVVLQPPGDGSGVSEALDEKTSLLKIARESRCAFLAQVFPSFVLAGLGMAVTGLLLDTVQTWPVFIKASELFILVPALLGLKGNLEMTLASRLATQANLGKANSLRDIVGLAVGNMTLLQCQSIVVGTLASVYAILTSLALQNTVTLRVVLLVFASSVVTASAASLVLGGVMISVVLLSRPCHINPDNVAIPIAAALGDMTTLGLLAFISSSLFRLQESQWVSLAVICAVFLLLPVWTYATYKNDNTRGVLFYGWLPIISSMLISSVAGNILDVAVKRYRAMAAFQPLMNGVAGNLAAVQASRLSTQLHQERSNVSSSVQASTSISGSSLRLAAKNAEANERGSWLLVLLVVPGHLIFMTVILLLKNGYVQLDALFVLFYNGAALLQMGVLLWATRRIVQYLWRRGMDPDSTAIPYVTALGDVLGTALLTAVFALMGPLGVDTRLLL